MTDLQYVENMRAAQAKIHFGDVRWYVVNAAGHIVRGPFLNREQADIAIGNYRQIALMEHDAAEARRTGRVRVMETVGLHHADGSPYMHTECDMCKPRYRDYVEGE